MARPLILSSRLMITALRDTLKFAFCVMVNIILTHTTIPKFLSYTGDQLSIQGDLDDSDIEEITNETVESSLTKCYRSVRNFPHNGSAAIS